MEKVPAPDRDPRPVRALASLVVMLGAAEVMVNGVIGLADRLGMAHGFAGLTLVGIGTSAPLISYSVQGSPPG